MCILLVVLSCLLIVGGRTALFNALFAAKHNGSMVLRIEDTDQSRLVAGATESLSVSIGRNDSLL